METELTNGRDASRDVFGIQRGKFGLGQGSPLTNLGATKAGDSAPS
jgi:hypothetical protein